MKDKINGSLKIVTALLTLYLLLYLIYLKKYNMAIDFSTEDSSVNTIGTYIGLLFTINYIIYFFINGLRHFYSKKSKYRFMYFISITLSLFIITGLISQLNLITNNNVTFSIENILIIMYYLISVYSIIIEIKYQFRRKNWIE